MGANTEFAAWATGIAGLLAAVSGALAALAKARVRFVSAVNEREKEKTRDYRSEVRLVEVRALLSQEGEKRFMFRVASASFIFGQFIVGGVLTSSFVTRSLNEVLIGLLGLIVLGSSLINQHFRPDFLHKIAAEKARRLRALKRWLEDEVYAAEHCQPVDEDRIRKARFEATRILEEIDEAEMGWLFDDKKKKA